MNAKLKQLYSLDFDLTTYFPPDSYNFGFWLRAMIGPTNQDGEESFDIFICTPEWLKTNHALSDVVWGRHFLIVFEYNLENIKQAISRYCVRCTGSSWQEVAIKLSRMGYWEFEDYQSPND